jgi:uncharacterized membrane protein YebE (DUF533 family)
LRDARYGQLPGPRPPSGIKTVRAFRIPVDLDCWLIADARTYGISVSAYLASVLQGWRQSQERKPCKQEYPVVAELRRALRVAELALADGQITAPERVRIQKPLAAAQNDLWNARGVA